MPGKRKAITSRRRSTYRPYSRRYKKYRSTVPRQYIRGRGDYKTWWGNFKRRWFRPYTGKSWKTGALAGTAAGEAIAPGIGGVIGGGVGALGGMAVDRIMSWGDYQIARNTIAIPTQAKQVPVFGKGEIRVRHKEYVGSILSSIGFSSTVINLNPGLSLGFPWLSAIAQNFEQYRWNGMVWNFVSTSADALNSTNTALGKVVLATDYNAADPPFVDIKQMMGTEFSNMGKPSDDILHCVECAPSEQVVNKLWVRTGPNPVSTDKRLYDHGVFQVGCQGSQAEAVIGDLWVTYDVSLFKPVQNNQLGYTIPVSHWVGSGTINNNNWFGTLRAEQTGSNIDGINVTANTIFLPIEDDVGTYRIDIYVGGPGSANAALTYPTVTPSDCTFKSGILGSSGQFSNQGVTDDSFWITWFVQCTGRDPAIGITPGTGTTPLTPSTTHIWIARIPHDIA